VNERRQRFDTIIESSCPLRREQTPEDIGKAAVFLASDDARNITGQALNVDGGIVMN
jgi:enoyl-[acyl-carrier-protein] reductase (NADH)